MTMEPEALPAVSDAASKEPDATRPSSGSGLIAGALLRCTRLFRAQPELLIMALLWLVFCWLKFDAIAGKPPIYSGDGRIWANIAEEPFFSRDFLLPRRPIVMPLLFKLGLSDGQMIQLQLCLSILAWSALAYALSRFVRRILSAVVFATTLLTAFTSPVNAWDLVIRAESTSHSILALTLASALLFLRSLLRTGVAAYIWATVTVFIATLAAFARDTNAYVLLLLIPTLLACVWLLRKSFAQSRRAVLLMVALLTIAVSLASFGSQAVSRASLRYAFPLMNVIFRRILPHPETREFFVREYGMPISRELMSRAGKFASSNRRYAFREPRLENFRDWIASEGYTAYQKYLLTHLGPTVGEAYQHFPSVLAYKPGREAQRATTPFSEKLDELLVSGPLSESATAACLALVSVGCVGLVIGAAGIQVLSVFNVFFVAVALSQLYVCYHGDAMEVGRHSVVVGIFFRLASIVSFAIGLDAIVQLLQLLRDRGLFARIRRGASRLLAARS